MLVGVDVGGTYTDAALLTDGRVARTAKVPTTPHDLLECLLTAMDRVLEGVKPQDIRRLVFSTSLVTNLIAQDQLDPVALLLLPGPGVNPDKYGFAPPTYCLTGTVDYRGREVIPLDRGQAVEVLRKVEDAGIRKAAVVGKFSSRNRSHETEVAELARQYCPGLEVEMGHRVAGQLNFPRRATTTRLTLATRDTYEAFINQVMAALQARGISAPAFVLKADAGSIPLEMGRHRPVDAIFSGPAACALAGLALGAGEQTAVVLDIGGTTSDLALILNGRPLLASRGARVRGYFTQVRALAVKSVALGGDSVVRVTDGRITLGPDRQGAAFCLGGPAATPTDAMRYLSLTDLGDYSLAQQAMAQVGESMGLSPDAAAEQVLSTMVGILRDNVSDMLTQWEKEPAYRVWEIMQGQRGKPEVIIGMGGAAIVAPRVAEALHCQAVVPEQATSANAIGAALARSTVYITLHADTEQHTYSIEEQGFVGRLPYTSFKLDEAVDLARQHLMEEAEKIQADAAEAETLYAESFNIVRDWVTSGRILDVIMQLAPGLVPEWKGI